MSRQAYIEFDEFIDVEASLATIEICLFSVAKNRLLWKQIIVGCHAALASASVAILTKTDLSGALNKQSRKTLLDYHNKISENAMAAAQGLHVPHKDPVYPDPLFVMNLREMLDRLPGDLKVSVPNKFDDCSDDRIEDLFRLIEWRNDFLHFKSVSWSIEAAGLPRISIRALKLVKKIAESSAYSRLNRFPETNVLDLIESCIEQLNDLAAVA